MRDEWAFEFLFEVGQSEDREVGRWSRNRGFSVAERLEFADTLADIRDLPESDYRIAEGW